MCRRVARHHRNAVLAMCSHQRRQAPVDFSKSLVPAGLNKHAIAFDQRLAQAVRVFMQVFKRHALGADVASTKNIGIMAPDADDLAGPHLDLQPTAGFTQRADAVVRSFDRLRSWVCGLHVGLLAHVLSPLVGYVCMAAISLYYALAGWFCQSRW